MRLGLYHGPLYHGPRGYETYGPYARYIAEFARHVERLIVFAPVARRQTDYRGCVVEPANVEVVELPDFDTHIQATRRLPALWRALRAGVDRCDVINCRNTAPYGYLLHRLARRRGIGFFYHFTSEPMEILRQGDKYRGWFGRFARFAFGIDLRFTYAAVRQSFAFVNGRVPYERLKAQIPADRLQLVISSTLEDSDLRERTTSELHAPVRVLFVGYLKHMKGLDYLLRAVAQARAAGPAIELHLVGSGPLEADLRAAATELGLSDAVRFHGYVPMGPELNRHYDAADIFVFPSLSEGSPRVVLEALAHSLPTISTNVGSVPDLITSGESGLIVPLRDAEAIAAALLRFIREDELRTRCMRAGFALARSQTLSAFIAPMIAKAQALARRPAGR